MALVNKFDLFYKKAWLSITALLFLATITFFWEESEKLTFILGIGSVIFLVAVFLKFVLSLIACFRYSLRYFLLTDLAANTLMFFVFKHFHFRGGVLFLMEVFVLFIILQFVHLSSVKKAQNMPLMLALVVLFLSQINMSLDVVSTIMYWPNYFDNFEWIYISASLLTIIMINFTEIGNINETFKQYMFKTVLPFWLMGFVLYSSGVFSDWLSSLYLQPTAFGIPLIGN